MIALLLLALAACAPTAPEVAAPDLVVIGAVHATPPAPAVEAAVVVRDGLVVDVVPASEGRGLAGPHTTVIEAAHVTPGFVDAHAHPLGLGKALAEVDLVGLDTYVATLARLEAAASEGSGWLLGRGWDQNDWSDPPPGTWPRAADLDPITGDRPAALRRVDGHALWVNSVTLAAAGIDASTPDPEGGRILRGSDGAPSGVLVDNAMDLVTIPKPDEATRTRWALSALDSLVATGLVGVHAMGMDDATLATWADLDASGRLPIAVRAYVNPGTEAHARLLAEGPFGSDRLRVVGVKAYGDGALGSRGALLSADYADEPGHRGLAVTPPETLRGLAVDLLGSGAQLAVHAIGDATVTATLDAFAAAREAHPDRAAVPLRVEHAQVVRPEDRPRFAALGAVASMQPTHATSDMPWAEDRLGPERIGWAYTWRSLSDAGALLAFGSDFPVEAVDPGLGLWAASTRTDLAGHPQGGWHPEEAVSLDEAIAAFTTSTWNAVGEARDGLVPGAPADLTTWSVDAAGRWHATTTLVAGRVLWRAD